MQRVTPGVGYAFGPVEDALKEIFVPALFEGLREGVPERGANRLPVKQAGLALPNPSQTAPENWTASCVITGHLVASLMGQVEFRTADHSACLREGWTAVRRRGQIRAEEALTTALEGPRYCTHVACNNRQRPVSGLQCSHPQSMERIWGPGNGATPSSYGMAWIPRTFPRTVAAVKKCFSSVTPLTTKRAASSRRITTSSVTG